jgi:hypothetical protein
LYKDRFGIEETFVKVETRNEEYCVTRRIGQESKVVLLVLDTGTRSWVREALSDVE